MKKITCGKSHSGNKTLHKHGKGWECAGCGAHYATKAEAKAAR